MLLLGSGTAGRMPPPISFAGDIFSLKTVFLLAGLFFLLCGNIAAEELSGTEYRVKAGFIYHFIRFTQWPADSFAGEDSPIVFCVAAAEPAAAILRSLENKMIRKRRIKVKIHTEAEELPVCHVLFVSAAYEEKQPDILSLTADRALLSIGESEIFSRRGGIIRFFTENEHLRFAVNLKAARQARLRMSSQLLMSAHLLNGDNRIP